MAEQNLRDILDDTISLEEEKDEIIKKVREKGLKQRKNSILKEKNYNYQLKGRNINKTH